MMKNNRERIKETRMIVVVLFILISIFSISSFVFASPDFQANSLLLKVSIEQGEFASKTISISNSAGGDSNAEIEDVPGAFIDENSRSFYLNAGEDKEITIYFNASNTEPDIYIGSIKVKNTRESFFIPVILQVQSNNVLFGVNVDIPPAYTEIMAKEKLLANIKIYDLVSGGTKNGLGIKTVDVEYKIYSEEGDIISSQAEHIIVDKETQITKTFPLPTNMNAGNYVLGVILKYESSVDVATRSFSISKKSESSIDLKFFSILAAIFLFFIVLVFFFMYLLKDRDKFILELKKYNQAELRRQREFLGQQRKILSAKKVFKREIVDKEVGDKIKALKEKHKEREKEFRKLRDNGNVKEMERRMESWKKLGYNTLGLEYRLKGLSEQEMRKTMAQWKRKYGG